MNRRGEAADGWEPDAGLLQRWVAIARGWRWLAFQRRKWAHLGRFLADQDKSEYRPQRRLWGSLGTELQGIKRRGRLTLAEQIPPRERARAAAEPEPAPEPARAAPAPKGAARRRRGPPEQEEELPWLVYDPVAHPVQVNINVNVVNNAGAAYPRDAGAGEAQAARGGGRRNRG